MQGARARHLAAVFVAVAALPAAAGDAVLPAAVRPALAGAQISIIIDDLGNRLDDGIAALELPGAVSYSFLPHTPYARRLAALAHQLDRDVLVHTPMESEGDRRLGPGGLRDSMSRAEIHATVRRGIASVPFAVGLSNHMGSLLTTRPEPMRWIMEALRGRGDLFFVDSRTTAQSIAQAAARHEGVPSIRRDVFLDHDPTPASIVRQFQRLVATAERRGTALGIAHPYPETLAVLRGVLPALHRTGVRLVPVSDLLAEREPRWRRWRTALRR